MTRHDGAGIAEQIYARLKGDVIRGAIDAHHRLDVAELAAAYGVSATPVREAAMRLLGERLLVTHRRGGLRPALLSEDQLRATLDAHLAIVGIALGLTGGQSEACRPEPADVEDVSDARALFAAIAQAAGNEELASIIANLGDRLERFRRIENEVLVDTASELAEMRELWKARRTALRRALRTYHRRRIKAAAHLVWRANA